MIGRFEVRKDILQVLTESAANHVGRIATIVTGAVRDITHEVGEWTSEVFEMREAAAQASGTRLSTTGDAVTSTAPRGPACAPPGSTARARPTPTAHPGGVHRRRRRRPRGAGRAAVTGQPPIASSTATVSGGSCRPAPATFSRVKRPLNAPLLSGDQGQMPSP